MDHPAPEQFIALLIGYLRESLNPQELDLFFKLAAAPENTELLAQSFQTDLESGPFDLSSPGQKEAAWIRLNEKLDGQPKPVRHIGVSLRWVAMLVCLLGAALAVYFFNQSKSRSELAHSKSEIKTPPWLTAEHIGATLFLGAGDSVKLDNRDRGLIATEDGIQILQSDGVIHYSGESRSAIYNQIRTGRGKLWRAVLPDQTVVWLNDNSSIKYPLRFGKESRDVEMTGEVYFEVAHHTDYPFRVRTEELQIEDIGTSFNIKSITDHSISTATLVEGSARVTFHKQEATLSAGQQSLVSTGDNSIRVERNANLSEALAWKNGFFYFRNAGLTDVMKQISDWYQADVIYKGNPGKELFNGQIDKTLSLSDVLQGLQQPGVKFSLDNSSHQITVIRQ